MRMHLTRKLLSIAEKTLARHSFVFGFFDEIILVLQRSIRQQNETNLT